MTTDIDKVFALLDAWADAPEHSVARITLNDDTGEIEYAFRLWCSARQMPFEIDATHHDQIGEWDVFRTYIGNGSRLAIVNGRARQLPQPVPGIRIESPPALRPELNNVIRFPTKEI